MALVASSARRVAKVAVTSSFVAVSAFALFNKDPNQHGSLNRRIQPAVSFLGRIFQPLPPEVAPKPAAATTIAVPENAPVPLRTLRGRFRVGDYYVWLYQDKDGVPTSWEKYSVTSSDDSGVVVIEMATKFSEDDDYFTHHRMTVDMADHLASFNNRTNWRLKAFEYLDGDQKWRKHGLGDNVQAFEEKFDVFSMLNLTNNSKQLNNNNKDGYEESTRVVAFEGESGASENITLARSDRHRYTDAWYAAGATVPLPSDQCLSGVAFLKHFAEHSFSLIKSGRGTDEIDIKIEFG